MDSDTDSEQRADPVEALRRLGVVAGAAELRASCDHWEIRKAVRDGRIVRAGPRRYALPGTKDAFLIAARLGGVVSHLDAAIYWGWKIKQEPDLPHVTMPRGHRRPRSDRDQARVHWSTLPAGSIYRGKVTQRARTVADCCRDLPWDEALCVVDSALREGKLTREELLAEIDLLPRTGRERARRVVLAADGRAANPFESCLRAVALTVPGLNVIPQFRVDDIGRADLVDPALRLVVEADSAEHHSDPASFRYDIRRYTAMVRKQWRVIRFCWEDVMFKQDYVRAVLADMVALGPPGYKQFVVTGSDPRLGGGT